MSCRKIHMFLPFNLRPPPPNIKFCWQVVKLYYFLWNPWKNKHFSAHFFIKVESPCSSSCRYFISGFTENNIAQLLVKEIRCLGALNWSKEQCGSFNNSHMYSLNTCKLVKKKSKLDFREKICNITFSLNSGFTKNDMSTNLDG